MLNHFFRYFLFVATFFFFENAYAQYTEERIDLSDTSGTVHHSNKVKLVTAAHVAVYGGSITGLSMMWYSKQPQSAFHFFDDNAEWLQVDKTGHFYGAYEMGRASHALWQWAGLSRKKSIWLGGLSGLTFQTIIEVLDGFQADYGFSTGDYIANLAGTATFVSQQLAWDEQRILVKFSAAPARYRSPDLQKRAEDIYGSSFPEKLFKDYNHQHYWLSADIHSLFQTGTWPEWLAIAVGYGADGMFGARSNTAYNKDGALIFDRSDIKRHRQWFLSPDIHFSKIRTRKKGVKVLLFVLDAIKIPAPTLEFSNGKFKGHFIYF